MTTRCPHCQLPITVTPSQRNRAVRCGCGEILVIPADPKVFPLPPVKPTGPVAGSPPGLPALPPILPAVKIATQQASPPPLVKSPATPSVKPAQPDASFEVVAAPKARSAPRRDTPPAGRQGVLIGLGISGGILLVCIVATIGLVLIARNPAAPPPPPQDLEDLALQLQAELMQQNFKNFNSMRPEQLKKVFGDMGAPPMDERAMVGYQLENLTSGNEFRRGMALHHFRFADPNHPERSRVAAALERAALEKPNSAPEVEALCRWATPAQAPALLQIANQGKNLFGQRHACVFNALGELKDERALPVLIEALSSEGFDTETIKQSIVSFGKKAEEPLLKTAFRKNPDGRRHAQDALQRLKVPTDRFVAACLAALADGDADVVRGGLEWLAKTPADEASLPQISKALNTVAAKNEFRGPAVTAMATWGTADNLPIVLDQLQGGPGVAPMHGPGTGQLLLLLGRLKDERAIPLLVERTGHIFEWQDARKALESFGPAARPGLIKCMFHPNQNCRNHVGELLKSLNTPRDEMLPHVLAGADSSDAAVKSLAFEWLQQNAMMEKILAQSIKDVADVKSRDAALEWIHKTEPRPAERDAVIKAIKPLVKDNYRKAVLPFLKWAGKDQMDTLIELVMAERNDFRSQSIDALAMYDDPKAAFAIATRVLNIFDRDKASAALKKMGAVAENPAMQMLTNRDPAVRLAACQILEDVGTAKALTGLNNLAKTDRITTDAATKAALKIKSRG